MEEGVLTRVTVRSSTYLPTAPTLLSVRPPPRPGYNRSQHKQDTMGVNTVASATTRLQPLEFQFVTKVVRSGRTSAPSGFGVAAHTAHRSTLRYYLTHQNDALRSNWRGSLGYCCFSGYQLRVRSGSQAHRVSCTMTCGDLQRFFFQRLKHFADDEGSARSPSSSPHQRPHVYPLFGSHPLMCASVERHARYSSGLTPHACRPTLPTCSPARIFYRV